MSIKIINNLDIIVYVGIEDDEKLPIFNKEYLELTKEEKEYTLKISEIYENFQDKIFKFFAPCLLKIGEDLEVVMERRGEIIKLVEEKKKIEKENSSQEQADKKITDESLKEIKKTKTLYYYFDSLKQGNFVFINDDRSRYYKIKKIVKTDKKIEFVLFDSSLLKKIEFTVDPFKCKLSPNANLKYRLVWFDDKVLEIVTQVNINSSISDVQDKITDSIKNFVKSSDIRFIYKGLDISFKALNKSVYLKESDGKKNSNLKEKKIEKIDGSTDEPVNLNIFFGEEEHLEECDNNISKSNEKLAEADPEKPEKDKELEEIPLIERIEKAKNLCELGLNFNKDYFTLLIPQNPTKLCNLYKLGSCDYSELKNFNIVNLFIFNCDLKVRNFCIAGPGEGGTFDKIDFLAFESNFKKQKYENEKEYNPLQKYDVSNIMDYDFWKNHKLIYEQNDIILKKNFDYTSDVPIEKIDNKCYILSTETIEFSKDRIYSFVFKLKDNPNGDYLYSFNKSCSKFVETINEDFEINAYTNKDSNFYLFGFDYILK